MTGEVERFMRKVQQGEGCWLWLGTKSDVGTGTYGVVYDRAVRRTTQAHRLAYRLFRGEIPADLTVDHLCRNTLCVNPEHMELVTMRENILRGSSPVAKNAKKTHCLNGHEFTPENTIQRHDGGRGCRICQRAYQRKCNRRRYAELKKIAAAWESVGGSAEEPPK